MMKFLNIRAREAEQAPTLDEIKEAMAFFVLLMIYASSGEIDEDAIESSLTTLKRCALFDEDTRDQVFQLLVGLEDNVVSDTGLDEMGFFRALTYDGWNLTAAAMAADVMMSDGVAEETEIDLLSRLAKDARIDRQDLSSIYGTIHALRRGWNS